MSFERPSTKVEALSSDETMKELHAEWGYIKQYVLDHRSGIAVGEVHAANRGVSRKSQGAGVTHVESIIANLRSKGLTTENEVLAALTELSDAENSLEAVIGITTDAELRAEKEVMRERIATAEQKLDEVVTKWEPIVTGAF